MPERLDLLQEGLILLLEAAEGAIDLAQAVLVQLLPLLLDLVLKGLPVVFELALKENLSVRIDIEAFFGKGDFDVLLQAMADEGARLLLLDLRRLSRLVCQHGSLHRESLA